MASFLFTGERDVFELKQLVVSSWHGLALKNLEREIKFNENELNAFYFEKHTNKKKYKKIGLNGEALISEPSISNAACLPIELRGTSNNLMNCHCQNQRNENGAGSLALRRCQVYAKKYL